ncbi:MAG TPA: glycosyltransferase family 39 protein [Xanthobacteraceae bacterium]|nr:glycosyltransferase family 39 protein [Xanthobacteraceae bacterium]
MTTTTRDASRPQRGRGLLALLDFAHVSHARAAMLLLALSVVAFLPGFFQIPPIDRDEARFAQATKQMVETGDYVDIRFQNEVRYKKPVGIYWMQAGAVKLGEKLGVPEARTTIWLYRIPSLIGAVGAVLLTYWAALAFVSRRGALLAGVMLGASILLGVEARLAKTDAMQLFFIVAAMGAMARVYLSEHRPGAAEISGWKMPAIFWTAFAGGVLLKGPLILMLVTLSALTLIALDRSARWLWRLRPIPGILWVAVLALPWFIAILSRSGDAFLTESLVKDLFAKVASGQESHGAPPGYYLALFWVTFWPAAPLTLLAASAAWTARREPGTRFLLAWIIPAWIVFEIVITKLPHYVLPLYPAIAILTAGALDSGVLSRNRWLVRGTSGWFIVPLVLCLAAITISIYVGRQFDLLPWPFAIAAMIVGLIAWWLYDSDGAERSLMRAAAASILIAGTLYGLIFPSMTSLFPSVMLAEILREADCPDPVAASAGYHEPSLIFLAGTQTVLTDGAGAADFLRQGGCRFAFIDARQERSFARRAEAIGLRYAQGPRIDAFNISGGRAITVAVYRSEAAQ